MSKVSWYGALVITLGLALPTGALAQRRGSRKPPPPPPVAEVSPIDVQALSGPDLELAAKAAETLGQIASEPAHEALLDALALGLPPAVAVPTIEALAMQPAPGDVAMLRRYARHRTPSVRSAALGALASYPSPEAQQAISDGLRDLVGSVRTAAASAAARGRVRTAVDELMILLARGEDSSARALGAMADHELAKQLTEQLGKAPDAQLARALGTLLLRDDFGPDTAKVEIVRTLAKIQDPVAVTELTDYINATPKRPVRASCQEAAGVVEARTGGAR